MLILWDGICWIKLVYLLLYFQQYHLMVHTLGLEVPEVLFMSSFRTINYSTTFYHNCDVPDCEWLIITYTWTHKFFFTNHTLPHHNYGKKLWKLLWYKNFSSFILSRSMLKVTYHYCPHRWVPLTCDNIFIGLGPLLALLALFVLSFSILDRGSTLFLLSLCNYLLLLVKFFYLLFNFFFKK